MYRRYRRFVNPRVQRIRMLIANPSELYKEIFASGSIYTQSIVHIKEIVANITIRIAQDPIFQYKIGKALVDCIDPIVAKQKPSHFGNKTYKHGMELVDVMNYCDKVICNSSRQKLIDIIIKYNKNFTSNAKKELAKYAVKYVSNETKAINILRDLHRTISESDFNILIAKITNGIDNPNVKNILSKSKIYDYLKYDEETVNNNYKERVKLIKAIGKTPTLIKRLPFIFYVGLKELKEVAPAMRFKLMQFVFKYEVYYAKYGWNYSSRLINLVERHKGRINEDRLVISPISIEEMKELLFSVCLKKNDEFTKWIRSYAIYLECLKSDCRVNIENVKI